jgi:hypothetical protein
MHLNASAAQMGYAARMRTMVHGKDRKILNQIVHSPDTNQKYGHNPFSKNKLFDENAQQQLKRIAESHRFTAIASDLELAAIYYRMKQILNSGAADKTDILREMEAMVDEFLDRQNTAGVLVMG